MSNSKNHIFFLRRLSFLLASGHSLHQSLEVLNTYGDLKVKKELEAILDWVASGHSFSSGLLKFKLITDSFVCQLIDLGEKTTTLARMVDQSAKELERKKLFKSKLLGSLIYPVCILGGTLTVGGAMIFFVFPKILPIFQSLGVPLPWSTRFFIGSIYFILHFWWLISFAVPLLLLGLWKIARPHVWRIPIIRYIWLSHFFRVMNLMLCAGLPVETSVLFCSTISNEIIYKEVLMQFHKEMVHGKSLVNLCKTRLHLFSPLTCGFIAAAEKAGTLAESFQYLSEFYTREVEVFLDKIMDLVEPALMLVLGIGIGFIAVALLGPIYSITQHVS